MRFSNFLLNPFEPNDQAFLQELQALRQEVRDLRQDTQALRAIEQFLRASGRSTGEAKPVLKVGERELGEVIIQDFTRRARAGERFLPGEAVVVRRV